MRWRPRLVLRFGRGGVASPTSSAGHAVAVSFAAVIAAGAAGALAVAAAPGRVLLAVVLAWVLFLGRALRDAWAWLAAGAAERAAFAAEVEAERRWTPPAGYAPIFDANRWGRATSAALVAAAGVAAALLRWHEGLLVPALFSLAFVVAGGLDLARAGRTRRAGAGVGGPYVQRQ